MTNVTLQIVVRFVVLQLLITRTTKERIACTEHRHTILRSHQEIKAPYVNVKPGKYSERDAK